MKNLFLIIGCALITGVAFGQANKTYVKTVDPQMSQEISLEFDHPYEVEQWDNDGLRMLIDVKLLNGSEKILEQLMLAGRYKITKEKKGEAFAIDIPGLKKEVTIRGVKLEEEVTLKLMVPRYTLVDSQEEDGLAMVNIKRGLSPELAASGVKAKFDPNFYEFDVEFNFAVGDDMQVEDPSMLDPNDAMDMESGAYIEMDPGADMAPEPPTDMDMMDPAQMDMADPGEMNLQAPEITTEDLKMEVEMINDQIKELTIRKAEIEAMLKADKIKKN